MLPEGFESYAGLSSLQLGLYIDDKLLHVLTFFLLTVVFYWIVDTNRRRTLNLTAIVCTVCLGVGSEFLQGFLPNGREFDSYDIVANIVGSLGALGLCSWYHKRMLERRRKGRRYDAVPGEDEDDLELGEGSVIPEDAEREEGVMSAAGNERATTLEDEVDNWDENAVDAWDEGDDDGDIGGSSSKPKAAPAAAAAAAAAQDIGDINEAKKRVD
ncbi:hypothetical protein TruAng_012235 [Truncatella angustata]|nr:hypothetical protein TruAng_012235 [Truncatella angustata]